MCVQCTGYVGAPNDPALTRARRARSFVLPACSEEAVDPDDFRNERLYFEEVCDVFVAHRPALDVIFDAFCKPQAAFMEMRGWLALLDCGRLLDEDFTEREVRLAYVWYV